jgi:hypothetical protein
MKNIDKYVRVNGTFLALTSDNVLVGYLIDVKPLIRPPETILRDILVD